MALLLWGARKRGYILKGPKTKKALKVDTFKALKIEMVAGSGFEPLTFGL